jgi:CRP/FNR family transcriptional regulator, cyclic AMP receptor protein
MQSQGKGILTYQGPEAEEFIDIDKLLTWGAAFKKIIKGECIFYEGSQANFYYQIVEGKAKLVNINEEGKQFIQKISIAGECLGLPPLFDDFVYAYSAYALDDGMLIKLNKTAFSKLIQHDTDILMKICCLFASRIRDKSVFLREVSSEKPEHRILTVLEQYKKSRQIAAHQQEKVEMTRQEIADITGLRVETVIRTMRSLHERGKIKIVRGKVYY